MKILAPVLALLWASTAVAHEWYDPACCSGEDCAKVRPSIVTATQDGWLVEIAPGDHPLVRKPIRHLFPYGDRKVRQSQDSDFHVCVAQYSQTFYCIYVPVFGA